MQYYGFSMLSFLLRGHENSYALNDSKFCFYVKTQMIGKLCLLKNSEYLKENSNCLAKDHEST